MKYILFCEDSPMYNKSGCEGITESFPEHKVICAYSGEDSIGKVAA
ncbi:MAG: hypothetical protein QF506_01615 [Candidatus Woesearchaeota archaeon]|jgi:hypothetical protein|nr:hypothetical protein [Candidatus Woesearchaeota archaeon]|tara:strand:+ start:5510 stop:5647 length:138 start_codon:yes stop_codon:yes gene_type:complete